MSRRQLCRDLNGVRGLVADGLARFEQVATGSAEFWVVSSLVRVRGLDGMLVAAAGGLTAWSRTLISSAIAFPLLWAVASAARAIGLGSAWVIVTTVLVLGVTMPGLLWLTGRISRLVDSRRMGATPRGGTVVKGDLDEVAEVLGRARVRLVSTALRRVDKRRWDATHLARLAQSDPVIRRIADADLLLCQAIDFLEFRAVERAAAEQGVAEASRRPRQRRSAAGGRPPEGSAAQRRPSEGSAAQRRPSEGSAAEGRPSEGSAAEGRPSEGSAAGGRAEGNAAERDGGGGRPAQRSGSERSGSERRSA